MLLWNLLADAGSGSTEGANGGSSGLGTYIIMGVLLLAIIGLFIWQSRTNKKKQKEAQDMVNSLKIGDRVKTIGGICGFVAQINDAENTFVLETGLEENKCFIKFDKGAIYQTAPAQGNAVAAPVEQKVEEKPATETASNEEKKEEAPAKKTTRKKKTEETK